MTTLETALANNLKLARRQLGRNNAEIRNHIAGLVWQRNEIANRSARETGSTVATEIAEADTAIATIMTRDCKPTTIPAETLSRTFAALLVVNRTDGTVRGGFELSDDYVFTKAAHIARLPIEAVQAIAPDVKANMRRLCA